MPLSAVKPENYAALLREKAGVVATLLAPFSPPDPEIHASSPTGFRMRAEFRLWHQGDDLNYVMFRRGDPKTPVTIDSFPIGCERIQTLMPVLLEELSNNPALRRKLFQVEFLSTLAGDSLVTLVYHRTLDGEWEQAARTIAESLGVSVVGRSRRRKIVLGRDWVQETLPIAGKYFHYRQYEQAFTQPNARVNISMIEWACARAESLSGDLLELYCGNGNFTLPLAAHFDRVIATEVSKSSIRAARENLEQNNISNVAMIRLAAEEVTQALNGVREFRRLAELTTPLRDYRLDSLFVDPPRAGLDRHTLGMAANFPAIIYVSCNPLTLAENLETLCRTHRIDHFAMFDQFPYTDHMECGVLLLRN
jgi:tRNA (uracil-5-)-methyltransferase